MRRCRREPCFFLPFIFQASKPGILPSLFPLIRLCLGQFLTLRFSLPESLLWPHLMQTFPGLRLFNALVQRISHLRDGLFPCFLLASPLASWRHRWARLTHHSAPRKEHRYMVGEEVTFHLQSVIHPRRSQDRSTVGISTIWPQHFEPKAWKGSFKHLMLELSSKTSIFKGQRMWETSWAKLSPSRGENVVWEWLRGSSKGVWHFAVAEAAPEPGLLVTSGSGSF